MTGSLNSLSTLTDLNFVNLAAKHGMRIAGAPEDLSQLRFMKKCNLEGCNRTITGEKEDYEKVLPNCQFFM